MHEGVLKLARKTNMHLEQNMSAANPANYNSRSWRGDNFASRNAGALLVLQAKRWLLQLLYAFLIWPWALPIHSLTTLCMY